MTKPSEEHLKKAETQWGKDTHYLEQVNKILGKLYAKGGVCNQPAYLGSLIIEALAEAEAEGVCRGYMMTDYQFKVFEKELKKK